MTLTCTAPTHIDAIRRAFSRAPLRRRGFTFIELMVVVVMISLFSLLTVMNFSGLLLESTFKAQVHEFVSALERATVAASESDRRYEVIIDLVEQTYLLRQITTPELSQVLEEEIILENAFSDKCSVAYVVFDDGEYTNDAKAVFRAGRSGFQYGGKIVLLDSEQRPYTVIINRLNRTAVLKKDDVDILTPKRSDELMF